MKYDKLMGREDFLQYAEERGLEAAANLLILVGPDGFRGGYENYKDLENLLNSGLNN